MKHVISKFVLRKIRIKWPNDLLYNKDKICGILQEVININKKDFLIIGIGLNTNNKPKNKSFTSTSLKSIIKKDIDNKMVLKKIKKKYENFLDEIKKNTYLELKKKCLVIFRCINVDYFYSSTTVDTEENRLISDWEVNKNKKIILMPCRLTAWKGQETFIEALNLVNKKLGYDSFNAVILGSDQGRDIYTKKIKRLTEQYRLTSQLKFIEHCKNMPLAYKISDIVVSASVEPEAFGRVAVEAQSMEKPIIASDIGGSNETIIDNVTGFLFQSGNAEALSKKIVEVLQLDESRLKSIGIEGRKNIIKKFNVEKMCFSTYSEYKKLLN